MRYKKSVLKNLAKFIEDTLSLLPTFNILASSFTKKETSTKFCEIFKNLFFIGHLRQTASVKKHDLTKWVLISHFDVILCKYFSKQFGGSLDVIKLNHFLSRKHARNFIEITLRHGWSLVHLLYIYRTSFPKSTLGGLLLQRQTDHFSHIIQNCLKENNELMERIANCFL